MSWRTRIAALRLPARTETVERIRNQVSLSAIKGLLTHMGSLKEGRKALLLVSEGFSNYVPPQLRDAVMKLETLDSIAPVMEMTAGKRK